jgi:hypothetical protein
MWEKADIRSHWMDPGVQPRDRRRAEEIMKTIRFLNLGLALSLAACGGSDAPRANSAAGATFAYGAPQPATAEQTGAMGGTISGIAAFRGSQDSTGALASSDVGSVTGQLFLSGAFDPTWTSAPTGAGFDVPSCVAVAGGAVEFSGCRITIAETSGGATVTGSATLNGRVSISASGETLTWDLNSGISLTFSDVDSFTVSVASHTAGSVDATDTTARGSATAEHSFAVSAAGQSASGAIDESLTFDVTHSPGCASGVTGGTLEAKRVWAARPAGASPADFPDEAVKVVWTACGAATVQLGTH